MAAVAVGHGMLLLPTPRNALDRDLAMFANGSWPPSTDGCDCANPRGGCAAFPARRSGQSCLWFSQGCSIYCPTCTGANGHSGSSLCGNSTPPTNNARGARTMNRDSAALSSNDTYATNPWRAPGAAPVADSCGMAGGAPRAGGGAAVFATVPWARQGDLGSTVLPKGPAAAVYRAGTDVEVAWGLRYNHGGGYQYRLCPANEALTEDCFRRTPLAFTPGVRPRLVHHSDGSETAFDAVYVPDFDNRSMWAMNPIPRITPGGGSGMPQWLSDACAASGTGSQGPQGAPFAGDKSALDACRSFDPVCHEDPAQPWYRLPDPLSAAQGQPSTVRAGDVEGRCSGDWTGGMIVDSVRIPSALAGGDYVLQWRWDCEETSQVWANCADVRIVGAGGSGGGGGGGAPVCNVTEGVDFNGADLLVDGDALPAPAADPQACCALCANQSLHSDSSRYAGGPCRAWSFNHGQKTCWMKNGTGHRVKSSDTSGVLSEYRGLKPLANNR
jgi:hypothetical protein